MAAKHEDNTQASKPLQQMLSIDTQHQVNKEKKKQNNEKR